MTYEEAREFEMPFGKYKGMTIREIAEDEDDQDYLEWLKDARDEDPDRVPADVDLALEAFLEV